MLKIELWRGLGASLETHGTWTDAQRGIALDLLGIHPEFRDAATPADPIEGDVLEAAQGAGRRRGLRGSKSSATASLPCATTTSAPSPSRPWAPS